MLSVALATSAGLAAPPEPLVLNWQVPPGCPDGSIVEREVLQLAQLTPGTGHRVVAQGRVRVRSGSFHLQLDAELLETNQPYWNISCASTGEEAMVLIARESFAVVITDLVMPGANGMALLYQLQQHQPSAIRIVHSSHVELLRSGSLGRLSHRVLPKPASAIDVLAITAWARQQFNAAEPPKSTRCA